MWLFQPQFYAILTITMLVQQNVQLEVRHKPGTIVTHSILI